MIEFSTPYAVQRVFLNDILTLHRAAVWPDEIALPTYTAENDVI
jgi:hypothetical protein